MPYWRGSPRDPPTYQCLVASHGILLLLLKSGMPRNPTAPQKDENRPLLAPANGAHCVGGSGTLCASVLRLNRWPPALCPPRAMLRVGSALGNISVWTTQLRSLAFVYSTANVKRNELWAMEKEGNELQRALCWELCWERFCQFMVCFLQLFQNFGHSYFCVISKALTYKKRAMQNSCVGDRCFAHMQKGIA